MNLDDELRNTLRTRAEEAPSGVALLDGVRRRVRRRRHRARIRAVGVVTAVGVGVAVTTPYLAGLVGADTQVAATAGPTGTHTASPTATALRTPDRPSTVELAAAAVPAVTFPLTPHWTPPGLPAAVIGLDGGGDANLVYEAEGTNLIVFVSRDRQPPDWTAITTQAVRVGSRPATLTTGTDANAAPVVRLTWQLADHRWVDVRATGLTTAQVKRYADNLTLAPLHRPLPFTLALAPVGHRVSFQELHPQEFHYCLARPGGKPNEETAMICLSHNPSQPPAASAEPVQVGPDRGEISVADDVVTLLVHRPGFEFIVTESSHGQLSNADLIRFAAGVSKAA
jgi:hypothetical protein